MQGDSMYLLLLAGLMLVAGNLLLKRAPVVLVQADHLHVFVGGILRLGVQLGQDVPLPRQLLGLLLLRLDVPLGQLLLPLQAGYLCPCMRQDQRVRLLNRLFVSPTIDSGSTSLTISLCTYCTHCLLLIWSLSEFCAGLFGMHFAGALQSGHKACFPVLVHAHAHSWV